jgi:DNA invertase Pin-like site-specific DNA recombinase
MEVKANYIRLSDSRQTPDSQMTGMDMTLPTFIDDGVQRDVPLFERPQFQLALEVLGSEGGIIRVSHLDRIGTTECIAYSLFNLAENIDIVDANGLRLRENEMVSLLMGYLAKQEKRVNSERQSRRAERQRNEGRLDCPQSFGFDSITREIIPQQMDALAIALHEYNSGTPVAEIMRIIENETGLKIARQRFYDWKKGKHFHRIPIEYLQKWSKKSKFEKEWARYYQELINEYGDHLMAREFWDETRDICFDSEGQQTMFLKVFLPWLENDNFLLQKPNTDHLVNRKGKTFAFGRYSEGFNEIKK